MIKTIRQAINKRAHQLALIEEKIYVLDMANDKSIKSMEDTMSWEPKHRAKSSKKSTQRGRH